MDRKRTAIVTGGSRGIGFAIARRLGREGCNVVVAATSTEEKAAENLALLRGEGTPVRYVQGRIENGEDRRALIRAAVESFGGVDILVNNAGVAPAVRADLLEMTEESFDRVLAINTKAAMFLTQLAARQMLAQPLQGERRGVIVNVSSCSSAVSSVNRGEYCVSKAGMSMLTTLYADRLAGEGISVYEVRPGVIATDMTAGVQEKYDKLIAQGAFPIRRWGRPEDVAGAVAAFCSEDFLYTTGNYIDVDGGFHIKRL